MVKICQTGLLKLNFETRPKKRIFLFLPKISAGHGWSWKFFFGQFPNPWALRVSGMGGYTSKCEKSQNHCTLSTCLQTWSSFTSIMQQKFFNLTYIRRFAFKNITGFVGKEVIFCANYLAKNIKVAAWYLYKMSGCNCLRKMSYVKGFGCQMSEWKMSSR